MKINGFVHIKVCNEWPKRYSFFLSPAPLFSWQVWSTLYTIWKNYFSNLEKTFSKLERNNRELIILRKLWFFDMSICGRGHPQILSLMRFSWSSKFWYSKKHKIYMRRRMTKILVITLSKGIRDIYTKFEYSSLRILSKIGFAVHKIGSTALQLSIFKKLILLFCNAKSVAYSKMIRKTNINKIRKL